jgi:glucose-1-phosphate adenylyltransferase
MLWGMISTSIIDMNDDIKKVDNWCYRGERCFISNTLVDKKNWIGDNVYIHGGALI